MMYKAFAKEDPPPNRVKPVPVPVLQRAYEIAAQIGTPKALATADMMWLGFFFLGRPGEYTAKSEESSPYPFSSPVPRPLRDWVGCRHRSGEFHYNGIHRSEELRAQRSRRPW